MRARTYDSDYSRPLQRHASLIRGLLLLTIVAGCVSIPERVGKPRSREIYRMPQAVPLQRSSLALLELGDVDWIQLDTLRIDHTEYGAVELPPGEYCIEMGKLFGVSVLVDPRMWVEHTAMGKVRVEAGRTYRLAADRTTGPGYTVSFALLDAKADSVVPVVDEPGDFDLTGPITPGDSIISGLDERDSKRSDCSAYEAYSLDIQADMSVKVTLESSAFDPYLLLVSPSGEFIASEDAGKGSPRVRIHTVLNERGRWLIVANTLTPGESGPYRLLVERR
jgi:hypothetical protein